MMGYLHNVLVIPKNGVVMEISSWVKPKVELHLSVANSFTKHIGVNNVRISTCVSQELKVYLIMVITF